MSNENVRNKAEWQARVVDPHLEAEPERRDEFTTISGKPLERTYTREDSSGNGAEAERAEEKLGYPGTYPFTRGVSPTMYRGNFWVMGMYSGFGSAEEANERYRALLERGSNRVLHCSGPPHSVRIRRRRS